jgi:dolichol kinase
MAHELARRAVHASGVVLPGSYLLGLVTWQQLQALFVLGTVVALVLEVLRLQFGFESVVYEYLTREYEKDNPGGYLLYAIGATAVVLAFQPPIALPAVLMLMLADPISGILGSDELRPMKHASVLLVMFGVCTFIASWFVGPLPAIMGGVAATFADGVKPVVKGYVIDDNVTIPVSAAVVMALAQMVPVPAGLVAL